MKTRDVVITVVVTNIVSILAAVFIVQSLRSGRLEVHPESAGPVSAQTPTVEKPAVNKDQIITLFDSRAVVEQKERLEKFARVMLDVPPYPASGIRGYPITVAQDGEYAKAEQLAKEEIRDHPESSNSYYMLAWIYARVGNYDGAVNLCNEVLPRGGAFNDLRYIMAWVYGKQQKYDAALKVIEEAIAGDPYSAGLYYGKGRILELLEKNDEAAASYTRAIELKKDFSEAYLFRGLTYAKMNRFEDAITDCKQTILFDRYDPVGYIALGLIYDRVGSFEGAIEHLRNAIHLGTFDAGPDPLKQPLTARIGIDETSVYNRIGVLNVKLGQYQEALIAFNNAAVSGPGSADAYYGLTLTNVLTGDMQAANENYQKLKRLSPELAATAAAIVGQNP